MSADQHLEHARAHLIDATKHGNHRSVELAILDLNRAIFLRPRDPKAYAIRGDSFSRLYDLHSAIIDLRYVVVQGQGVHAAVRHRLATILDLRGFCWLRAGDARAALECFKEASQLDPLSSRFFAHCAIAHTKLKEFDAALRHISRAIDLDTNLVSGNSPDPSYAEQFVLRAKLYWALGLIDVGIKDMSMAMSLAPDHIEVRRFNDMMQRKSAELYRTALNHMMHHDFSSAIKLLTAALRIAPRDIKLLVTRASAHRQAGACDIALVDLSQASTAFCHSMRPSSRTVEEQANSSSLQDHEPFQLVRQRILAYNNLALEAMHDHRPADALLLFNRVIKAEVSLTRRTGSTHCTDHRFYVNRGDCFMALGQTTLAVADFNVAFAVAPHDWAVTSRLSMMHYNIGASLFNEGNFAGAEVELSAAIKRNPKVAQYFACRGQASYYQHKFDAARLDFQSALHLDPSLHEIRVHLQQFTSVGYAVFPPNYPW
mmetsp:Transcript_35642/g.120760  ORF Transcript_35642/g.120760 Transcript_35642/m.120760 type:complete len:486 (-) Transcript_35642:529-1986(-)